MLKQKPRRPKSTRRIQRVDRSELKAVFIPKGTWMAGLSANYREWDNENINFVVLKNLDLKAHILSVSPAVGYFFADNLAVGARYNYSRQYFDLGSLELSLGEDLNINLKDLYDLEHKHEAAVFMRYYTPLFGSKIFGCFAEARFSYANAQGKNSTGIRDESNGINTLDGSYVTAHAVQLGVSPGICVFVTDFLAVETSIGVMGINYQWTKYKNLHPGATEYEMGKSNSGGANFRFNIFSVNLGLTFYL
ncbi:MAG: hypothetical protein K2J00_05485 [Bacteroidaceae bacterium]|nr:hypothetical protein [Bacteroidaceae bacterium]